MHCQRLTLTWTNRSGISIQLLSIRLHERCLRIIYSDKKFTFIELLGKYNIVSINKRNLCFLAIEMFKFKRSLALALSKKMVLQNRQSRYKLPNNVDFTLPLMKSIHKGLERFSYRALKFWKFYRLSKTNISVVRIQS